MGSQFSQKKPRILCLHGHGASAKFLENLEMKRWPEFVLEEMDLVYIDAPFVIDPSRHIEYDPPYYTWYKIEDDQSFEKAVAYIEEQMIKLGPFDGVLGVSQGGGVTATLPGMQRQGVALTKVPRIKFVIIISGPKLGATTLPCPELAKNAFSSPLDIPSLHIIGERDKLKEDQFKLLESFVNPTLLYHHEGHGVPHLDDNGVKMVLGFLKEMRRILFHSRGGRSKMCYYLDLIASLFCFKKNRGIKLTNNARVRSLI
ncbi:OLC1v1011252C1 [Oldenlandia corymbosa var. corymbosa]|uniref:OLC1v1011252C1 n=1 Tax=Oldenlandia corymbosa var. corymbosa TaxID=529605 RepID=A0AAV1DT63_OLDCO|nr:OLC1v1011252C1 [Oldenlandia corymbosa var. corymbosa]